MKSILNSVKKYCGVDPEYDVFDDQIIPLINSYLNVVNQLGSNVTEVDLRYGSVSYKTR